jgi:hypothetical protein
MGIDEEFIEEVFGWGKTVGGLRKTTLRGTPKNRMCALLISAVYNLLRIGKVLELSPA